MEYSSHRLRAQEKKVFKKFIWSLIFLFGGLILGVFAGIPLLAKLAVGLSLIKSDKTTVYETGSSTIFAPVVEPLASATNSGTIIISGYSDIEREIIVSVNGQKAGENLTDEEGKFKFRGIKINPGENKISVIAKYKDQESVPSEFIIVYKKDPPNLEISEPSDGQTLNGEANITIVGSTDPDARISVNDRLVIVGREGSFNYPVSLKEGENIFKVKAEDDAGNSKEN